MHVVEILFYGGLGLIIGSFLNVLILRHGSGRAIRGRSACPSCNRELAWYELVPVLSWLLLRGKCRTCKAWISVQYPLVEITTGTLFVLIGVSGLGIVQKFLALCIIALFIAIFVYDLYHTLIPDSWSYTAAFLAFAFALLSADFVFTLETAAAGPAVALPLFLMWFLSSGRWMGLGDAKLALSIGWLLGITQGMFALLGAFVLGSIISIFILLPLPKIMAFIARFGITSLEKTERAYTMQSEVPFGPFLIWSCLLIWFLTLYGFDPFALLFGL